VNSLTAEGAVGLDGHVAPGLLDRIADLFGGTSRACAGPLTCPRGLAETCQPPDGGVGPCSRSAFCS
jgi:hypothetical protein